MPSVRPKLVEEGVPISSASSDSGDATMMEEDHKYLIGGNNPPTNHWSSVDTEKLYDNASSLGNDASKKKISSLAKASKGSLMNATDRTKSTKKMSTIQTSFVVGGRPSQPPTVDSLSSESQSGNMAVDDVPHRKRTSLTTTSFQVPSNNPQHNPSISSTTNDMEAYPVPSSTSFANFDVHSKVYGPTTSYIVEGTHTISQQYSGQINSNSDVTDHDGVEKMEGVIDLSEKPPIVVIDGANIAYAYNKATQGGSSLQASQSKPEPDVTGIVVACHYFLSAGIRVLAVVPSTWTHREPHQSVLEKLNSQGLLVPAPPKDDDDAYAITIARREDARAQKRGDGPGYVLSNDMFRDAIARETAGGNTYLKGWLTEGHERPQGKTGPGRISFAFCDTGSMDDHGDRVLDILPNPRHPLVQFVEHHRGVAQP